MSALSANPSLKEINALKKSLTWGDIPAIYSLLTSSVSEMDGVLSYGFDNPYKQLLNKSNLNYELLGQQRNANGEIEPLTKPTLYLHHNYGHDNYELHCYLALNDERVIESLVNKPHCPFKQWYPERMKVLFRLKGLVPFIGYCLHKGDEADLALLRFAHFRILQLISTLMERFDIIDVQGYTIAQFCQEISAKRSSHDIADFTQLFLEK